MKILLTVHQFFPEYFSGTEVLTYSVAKELLARGHDVFVFTGYPAREQMSDERRFDQYDVDSIRVYRFHHAYVPLGGQQVISEIEYNNHLTASYFKALLADIKPDIVHFFHFSRLGAALVDVVRQLDIPAYYTPTDFWAICPTSQLLLADCQVCAGPSAQGGNCVKHVAMLTRWRHYSSMVSYMPDSVVDAFVMVAKSNIGLNFPFRREIAALSGRKSFNVSRLNALNGIVAPTQLMTNVLIHNGVKPELIAQSAYGINVVGFDGYQREYRKDQPITIGYIGTLAHHKGCHVLIDAFTQLKDASVRLKIYGNLTDFPGYVAELHDAARDNDAIEFCGTFPNDQIANVLSTIDVLVVPSVWYENTPLVVYSALASKCPVIASDFPGMSEVVRDGWNGLLFEPSNVNALTDCLARLHQQVGLLADLSQNCQPPKSIGVYVDELLALYANKHAAVGYPLPNIQNFDSYVPKHYVGYISGWAVVAGNTPKRICLINNNQEIGCATQFFPRPDVRRNLREAGVKIKQGNFGFTINLMQTINKPTAILEVEAVNGDKHQIPYQSLQEGKSICLEIQLRLGLDREDWS